MPMPTTRRDRFLFFRLRAENREKRAWATRPRYGADGHHTQRRSHDTRELPKQWPYEGVPKGQWQSGYWESTPDSDPLKGRYQKPGIVEDTFHPFPEWGPNTHVRFRETTYYMRRQKRIPMLRNLPLRAFLNPSGPNAYKHFWPFFRYPSGQLNPNWWKGLDDDGNPPPPPP